MKNIYIKRLSGIVFSLPSLADLAKKQFKTKYSGSRLGLWWAVLTPLALAVSINFVFNIVYKINFENYTFFVLAGIIPWLFFVETVQENMVYFVNNAGVFKQSIYTREHNFISSTMANLINFVIGLFFLLPLFVILNPKLILLLPVLVLVVLLHYIFTLGLAFLFATAVVFIKDIKHFSGVLFMVWFWITPVFYSLDMIEYPFRWAALLNPMTFYIESYRDVLLGVKIPDLSQIFIMFGLSLAMFVIGFTFFIKKEAQLLKKI